MADYLLIDYLPTVPSNLTHVVMRSNWNSTWKPSRSSLTRCHEGNPAGNWWALCSDHLPTLWTALSSWWPSPGSRWRCHSRLEETYINTGTGKNTAQPWGTWTCRCDRYRRWRQIRPWIWHWRRWLCSCSWSPQTLPHSAVSVMPPCPWFAHKDDLVSRY